MSRRDRPVVRATDPEAADLALIQLAVANVGVLRAGHALACLATWLIARHKAGAPIDPEGYGEFWRMSRSQAFRDQATIRKAFPEVDVEKVYGFIERTYRAQLAEQGAKRDRKESLKLAGELSGVRAGALT